jgi:hypothetical protein
VDLSIALVALPVSINLVKELEDVGYVQRGNISPAQDKLDAAFAQLGPMRLGVSLIAPVALLVNISRVKGQEAAEYVQREPMPPGDSSTVLAARRVNFNHRMVVEGVILALLEHLQVGASQIVPHVRPVSISRHQDQDRVSRVQRERTQPGDL